MSVSCRLSCLVLCVVSCRVVSCLVSCLCLCLQVLSHPSIVKLKEGLFPSLVSFDFVFDFVFSFVFEFDIVFLWLDLWLCRCLWLLSSSLSLTWLSFLYLSVLSVIRDNGELHFVFEFMPSNLYREMEVFLSCPLSCPVLPCVLHLLSLSSLVLCLWYKLLGQETLLGRADLSML